ncbi:MAG: transporter substrate-binding domain-containing protein [Mycoplasmatales bacterium]
MKKILGIIVVAVLILAGCSNKDSVDSLVIGSDCDYAPNNWTTTSDKASSYAVLISGSKTAYCDGYDVKVASEIAKGLNKTLVVKKIAFDGLIPALQSGEIDAIITGMSPTDERKQIISFTNPYYVTDEIQGIMVKKDSGLDKATSLNDFSSKKISAQLGTMQMDLISQIQNVISATALQSYNDLIQALNADTIDGYVVDGVGGMAQELANPNFKLVVFEKDKGFVLNEGQTSLSIGIKKDNNELVNKINDILESIIDETRTKWMDEAALKSDFIE